MRQLLIIGCGAVGRRVATVAQAAGWHVTGTVRSAEKSAELAAMGISSRIVDLNLPDQLTALPVPGATILYLVPPPGGGHTDPRMRNFTAALTQTSQAALPAKFIYLSTSGVYGDQEGGLVTEATPALPQTARGKRRLDAEETCRAWGAAHGVPVVILRVTGIYGPGKLPYQQLQQSLPILREEESSITNRIHIDDLAQVCLAAAERGEDGDLFNVSDGHPTTMTHYFNAVADALGLPRPPQVSKEEARKVMTPLMLSYFEESRRMDNRLLREKLRIRLRYPTLKEGLQASV